MDYGTLQLVSLDIATGIAYFLFAYQILLLIRVLLTWFPAVDWSKAPFTVLSQLTDPYLNLFRSLIPPLGGIDFSPILAFIALSFVMQFFPPVYLG